MLVVMMMYVVVMVIQVVVHARGDDDLRSGDGDLCSGACSW
jgi:hypothetical protein